MSSIYIYNDNFDFIIEKKVIVLVYFRNGFKQREGDWKKRKFIYFELRNMNIFFIILFYNILKIKLLRKVDILFSLFK